MAITLSACMAKNKALTEKNNLQLALSSFEISIKDLSGGIKMTESGQIEGFDGKIMGRITPNGLIYGVDGKIVAKLTQSGLLENSNGQSLMFVKEDGTLDNGSGVSIYWSEDGHLMKGDEQTGFILSPSDSPSRRAASIAISLYFSFTKTDTDTSLK
jgi:hypothetical protein